MRQISFLAFVFCVFGTPLAVAEDFHIDPELQQVLNGYMKNVRQEQLGQTRKLEEQLEILTKLKVSSCLLVDWLKSISSKLEQQGAKLEYLLGDKVDEHQRVVDETYKDLANRLRIDSNTSPETELQIRELAYQLLRMSFRFGLSRMRLFLASSTARERPTERIVTVEAKLDHLALKYRADYKSLCARMAKLEKEMANSKTRDKFGQRTGSSLRSCRATVPSHSMQCLDSRNGSQMRTFHQRHCVAEQS